jgi:serine/threonine protein kinase
MKGKQLEGELPTDLQTRPRNGEAMSNKSSVNGACGFPEVESDLSRDLERIHDYGNNSSIDLSRTGEEVPAPQPLCERNRYAHEAELGQGGMGTVYRAHDTVLHRSLAMKVLSASQNSDSEEGTSKVSPEVLRRFLEEAQVTGQLDHPGIIALHELGLDSAGRVYFTMPLVRGRDFGDILELVWERREGWDLKRAVSCLLKVAEAMAYAHSKGVIHRDLKPANIMAGRFGEVHVMDWGLAKILGHEEKDSREEQHATLVRTDRHESESADALATLEGSVLGTPAYMAPEQARGEQQRIDGRSDVYSLGAVLYHALTGQAPYVPRDARVSAYSVLQWALEGPPKPISELVSGASPELVAICERAMSREPEDRYDEIQELAEELRRYLRGEPVLALPQGPVRRTARWCRRNPAAVGVLAAVSLLGALGLWGLSSLSAEIVRSTARDGAAMKAAILEEVNTLYSAEISGRAKGHITLAHDYAEQEGAIPLPATFLTLLGDRISANESGVRVRHFSDHAFSFRTDGGPRDDFEREALDSLRAEPSKPYYRFDEVEGSSVLRFAAARIMKPSCVECHNSHPDSTKTDWKVGDVRGAMAITQPLENDIARTQRVLRGTFLVIGAVIAGALALFVSYVARSRRSTVRR